jgi:hypothetical protein
MTSSRSQTLTGALGLVSAALLVSGFALVEINAPTGEVVSDREVVSYFTDHKDAIFGGATLMFGGVLAFLPFLAGLRTVLRRGEPEGGGASSLVLAAGAGWALFILAGISIMAGIPGAMEYGKPFTVDPDTARLVMSLSWTPWFIYGGIAATVLIAATSISARRTGALPRMFVRTGFVLAALLLVGTLGGGFGVPVIPLWMVTVSAVLIARPGVKDRRASAPVQPAAEVPA